MAEVTAPPDALSDKLSGEERALGDGETVFAEGQPGDFAYRIVSGRIRLTKSSRKGPVRLDLLGPGDIFGTVGVLDGGVRNATARADGPAVLRAIDRDGLAALVERRPETALALVGAMGARLRRAEELATTPDAVVLDSGVPAHRRPTRQATLERIRLDFQPAAMGIADSRTPWAAKGILYAILGFAVSATVWAALARVDRVVVARGKLVTLVSKIVVQPLETATIRSIAVHVGEIVHKGDVLVSLDPTFARADERSIRAQLVTAAAEIARLRAELADAVEAGRFSDDKAEQRNQVEIFLRRRSDRDATVRSFEEEIKGLRAKEASLRADRAAVSAQLTISVRLEAVRQELYGRGNGSLINLLDAQQQVATARRELGRITNELAENAQQVVTAAARREAAVAEIQGKAVQQLETALKDFARLSEQIKKHERLADLVELRAPAKAMVLELEARSVGSVIREGEPIVTLVPLDVPLEIEAAIEPKDIGHLRTGDAVRIKLEALPYQKYGTLDGAILSINGDIVDEETDGRKTKVYKSRIAIVADHLRALPPDFALVPGMAGTCEIKVGTRSLISYFLYPIVRTLDSGLRDP